MNIVAQDAIIDWDEPFDPPKDLKGPVFTVEEFVRLLWPNSDLTFADRALLKRHTTILRNPQRWS